MRAPFSMCLSLTSPLFLTLSLLYFCDGVRNDFYLVHTSILAPILAPNLELSGSSLAFVGDQKLTRFRLSFFIVFDTKMAPKSDFKTVHKNHILAPCFKTQVSDPPWHILGLILNAARIPPTLFSPSALGSCRGQFKHEYNPKGPLGEGPPRGGPFGPPFKREFKREPKKGTQKGAPKEAPKREPQPKGRRHPKGAHGEQMDPKKNPRAPPRPRGHPRGSVFA